MPKLDPVIFGTPTLDSIERARNAFFHSQSIYSAIMDDTSLRDVATLDTITKQFPTGLLREFDLFLLLSECMANAVGYNNIKTLGMSARPRGKMLLISVFHDPPIAESVDPVIRNAHDGWLPDFDKDPPNGLGFPILFRIAYQITISGDRSRLQLWIRLKNTVNP